MRTRKIHACTVDHRFTACRASNARRYVAHSTAGASVNCVDCLRALVDLLNWGDFKRYLNGERIEIPHLAERR